MPAMITEMEKEVADAEDKSEDVARAFVQGEVRARAGMGGVRVCVRRVGSFGVKGSGSAPAKIMEVEKEVAECGGKVGGRG